MFLGSDILRLLLMGAALLLSFLGIGLYLRAFWAYFRTVRWLHRDEQQLLRRRYRSSALAVILREPGFSPVKRQLLLGLFGLPVFVLASAAFNALQHAR